jgi:hypothetical protein
VRKLASALTIAAMVAMAVALPTAAEAASPPVVQWASTDPGDLARIVVNASSEAGIASVVVHVVSMTTLHDVAVVSDFGLISGDATQGTWEEDTDLIGPDLGYYSLTVDITDNDGVRVERAAAGNMNYSVQMYYVDLNSTPSVTYTKRDFVVTGQLIAHRAVEMVTQSGDIADGTTNANGLFKLTTHVQNLEDTAYVTTLDDQDNPYYLQAYADIAAPKIVQAATKLTIHVDRKKILSRDPITVSGDLSWKSPAGWVSIPDASLAIELCLPGEPQTSCTGSYTYVTTDDQGHYTVVINPYVGGSVQAGTYNADPFITTSTFSSQVPLTVVQTASISDFAAYRDPANNLITVSGQVFFDYESPGSLVVNIQFSATGTGGWHTVSTLQLYGAFQFSENIKKSASGYWRVTYAGQPDVFQSATSPAIYVQ